MSTLKDKWKFYQWVVLEETESEKKNESVLFFFFSKDCLIYKKVKFDRYLNEANFTPISLFYT